MKKKPSSSFIELIKDKKELFESYRVITLQLKEALSKKNLTDVQSYIAKRQQTFTRINSIDKILKTMGSEGHNEKKVTSNHMGKEAGIFFQDMEQTINDISALEHDCMNLAATERDFLKHELLGYQQSKRRTKGYRSGNTAPAKFIDTMIR